MSGPVAVIGAGMAGLTAAWRLMREGREVVCFGAQAHPGGVVQSTIEDGYQYEHGPHTVMASAKNLRTLIDALGLSDEVHLSSEAASDRFIWRDGSLRRLPTGPKDILSTNALSVGGKLRLLSEPWRPALRSGTQTESVAAFIRRRLGDEVLDYFADPFISGIYAGDPSALEMASAFPQVVAMEQEHGSLMKAMRAMRRRSKAAGSAPSPKGLLSFRQGLGRLPQVLAEQLGERLRLGEPVERLSREGSGFRLTTSKTSIECAELVCAAPAYATAGLVESFAPTMAGELRDIPYAGVAVVHLGFPVAAFRQAPEGFGVLIPRNQGIPLLGAIFASSLYPERAPEGQVLLSCFIGGSRNPGILQRCHEEIVAQVVGDLRLILGVSGDAAWRKVIVWPRAIPQYVIGHGARKSRIGEALREVPGLSLVGNYLEGISLDATVGSALN